MLIISHCPIARTPWKNFPFLYFVILPLRDGRRPSSKACGCRARAPKRYDWKAWACSLADLLGRRVLALHSLHACRALAGLGVGAPAVHPVARQCLVGAAALRRPGVLLLLVSPDQPHLALVLGGALGAPFAQSAQPRRAPIGWAGSASSPARRSSSRRWCLLGFTPTVVLSALFLNLLYQFWLHADWIPRLGWLEYVFNTPSSHRVHHARNPEYLDANLWRRADRVRPPVRQLYRRARRRALRLRADLPSPVVAQSILVRQLRAVDRPFQGSAVGALAARGLDVSVRPAGLAAGRRRPDDGRDPPARRPRSAASAQAAPLTVA